MIQKKFIYYADLALLAVCLTGVYQLWIKADLPFHLNDYNSRLIVDDTGGLKDLKEGDLILKVDGIQISSRDDIETITDGLSAGNTIQLTVRRNEEITSVQCTLIRFYSLFYILTVMAAGIIFFAVAVFVARQSPDRKPALVFHWVVVGTAAIIMTTWGSYAQLTFPALYLVRSTFHFAYLIVPVNFVHFTLVFPKENFPGINKRIKYLYLISVFAAVITQTAFLRFVSTRSSDSLSFYTGIFTAGRVLMILCVIAGISLFILSYRRSRSVSDRKKIKWILFSLITGPGSFILLWVIPQAVINYGLIPEEAVILLMTLVPVGFAFAIIRHHIFNIDHIINRSLVYSILLALIAAVYFISVYAFSSLVKKPDSPGVYLVTTAFVAFLFSPVKVRVQGFVDRRFFRINYNFRKASRLLLEEIRNSGNLTTLASKIESELNNIIPLEQMGIYLCGETGFIYTAGHGITLNRQIRINPSRLIRIRDEVLGLNEKVEDEVDVTVFMSEFLRKKKLSLIFPIRNSERIITGFILSGDKSSGHLYTAEDIDLYNSVCIEAGLQIEKIHLSASLIRKELEREKLLELSELKSFFLSAVTHDLKSPITSIRIFSELLGQENELPITQKDNYLEIIKGECDRLTRMIDNMLDLTKIEKGIKEYQFIPSDLNKIASYAVNTMSYQFRMANCCIDTCIPPECFMVLADSDSLTSAVINLLSNAVKYSIPPGRVTIITYRKEGDLYLKVVNNGIPFTDEELMHLSELYFRTGRSKNSGIHGSGLGLYLIKQIAQAHRGRLAIENEPGQGCSFTIILPEWRNNEENTNN